jgi:predicted Zn-dependent protease
MGGCERPSRARRAMPASRAVCCVTAFALVASLAPARAQNKPPDLPIVRDSEIEQLLRDYTAPILRAAGLAQQNVKVVLINDRSFNAFVMDGRHIFMNVGALYNAKTPNEIIGVLAHETGHMAGGHLARLREQLAGAQIASIIAMLLGAGAIAAAASTRGTAANNVGAAAGAVVQAPQEMIRRTLLSYQRAQEESADRAGLKFLNATQQSAKGMHTTFKRFADDILIIASRVDPYQQSHPMPRERMAALDDLVKTNPYWDKTDPPELQLRHDMMRAKLAGFLERPDTVMRRYPSTDTSLAARYARAISAYRFGGSAQSQIDALIAAQPNNPYFHELKGQALLEGARPAEAIAPLRRAASLAPDATLIRIMLGQALVATGENRYSDEAISLLKVAMQREPDAADVYSQLAMAYGRKGELADADLASSQAALARGDMKTARELAARAKTRFPTGSPGWVKADDIVGLRPPKSGLFSSTNFTIGPVQSGPAATGPTQ